MVSTQQKILDIRNSSAELTSWVLGVNIEQNNNAVNAREANTKPWVSLSFVSSDSEHSQSTKSKDPAQRNLVLPCPLQVKDDRQRQCQDDEIHNNIEALVYNEENIAVDAGCLDALIPVPSKRPTL